VTTVENLITYLPGYGPRYESEHIRFELESSKSVG
jgi:hypothetical protein